MRDTPPPDDTVWHWFVCNGPHGERSRWVNPVLKDGGELQLLRRFIAERTGAMPEFAIHARSIAAEALDSCDRALVLKGIHVLTAIGTDEEIHLVIPLADSDEADIARHARTALFERGIKKRKR